MKVLLRLCSLATMMVLSGCAREGEIDETGGISITRSTCPAIAVPANTGDITLFNPPSSREARAIDVTATITNMRLSCNDQGADVIANATFDVQARRANRNGARTIELPYYAAVIRGGNTVVAKRVQFVTVTFSDGQDRATAQAQGGAVINRALATLPEEVRRKLTRRRKANDADASIDPLAAPDMRAAVASASFELLIGFNLSQDQLQYNATR